MILSVTRFNRQLQVMGQDMTWSKAAVCPCLDQHTASPRRGCPVCHAKGFLWAAPVKSRAGVSGMKVQREWERSGKFESGDVVVSVGSDTPLYAAAENDRVVFLQSSEGFDTTFVHGDVLEAPSWKATAIDRCFWLTPDGSALVEGGIPVQGPDRAFTWPSGQTAPPVGTRYTLQGRRLPEYMMHKDLGQDRAHFGGLALPRKLVLRKADLVLK